MIFCRKLQLLCLALALAAAPLPASAGGGFGWGISGVSSWQSSDGAVSATLDSGQAASVEPLPVPDLPAPWIAISSAYSLSTEGPLGSLTIRPFAQTSGYTTVLVQLPDGTWGEVESTLGSGGRRTVSHPGKATLVLASRPDWQQGEASWYRFRGCPCAASTVYPRGTKLVVTRADVLGKSVVVTVNDYGPEAWTNRAIDLDVSAFKQLGSKRAGLLTVTVKPL